jgi:hypothetical protein
LGNQAGLWFDLNMTIFLLGNIVKIEQMLELREILSTEDDPYTFQSKLPSLTPIAFYRITDELDLTA